jgi:ferrous iron transport protein B
MSDTPPSTTDAGQRGAPARASTRRVALLGNPNTGKTTLFNRLTGLRHHTSNFPGTTVEARVGRVAEVASNGGSASGNAGSGEGAGAGAGAGVGGGGAREIIDLPGVYSLELEQAEARVCREVLAGEAGLRGELLRAPDGVCVVLDATNLARNLMLAGEVLRRRLPTVVALNMIDLAERQGLRIDVAALSRALGCPVVAISARSGRGVDELMSRVAEVIDQGVVPTHTPPGSSAGHAELRQWAEGVFEGSASGGNAQPGRTMSDRADRVLTHRLLGPLCFALIMAGLFFVIFSLAHYPMGWIDAIFAHAGSWLGAVMPDGLLKRFVVEGVVGGVGATLIFLPQICLLFFLIALLEDTGYLARGAFVTDRLLRRFGLPGQAFVPLLSSHACALPGIMSARVIPDRRERLATILVAPFMTCSARLPVYVLLTGILFPGRPLEAALAFVGCYALGIFAGVFSAWVARGTILRGPSRPLALELPSYKRPSIRSALVTTWDRGGVFVRKAGTMILAVSVVLWWLGSFPGSPTPPESERLRQVAAQVRAGDAAGAQAPALQPPALREQDAPSAADAQAWAALSEPERREAHAAQLEDRATRLEHREHKAQTYIGQIGHLAQPLFAPFGADWQLSVGIMASFAAREVFVSTMSVVVSGSEEDDDQTIRQSLEGATRTDGRRLFDVPTSWALLVFYVLAMQCLPTLVVTAREAGHVKWALLQFAWMTLLAFVGATLAYHGAQWVVGGGA